MTSQRLLHTAFDARANADPDRVAVEIDCTWLSYGELQSLAQTLSVLLVRLGVSATSTVAVFMERCLEVPVAMLGVLYVGAAILPLADVDENVYIADVHVLLTTHAARPRLLATNVPIVLYVDVEVLAANPLHLELEHKLPTPEQAAYVLQGHSVITHEEMVLATTYNQAIPGFNPFHVEMWRALTRGHEVDLADHEIPIALFVEMPTFSSNGVQSCVVGSRPTDEQGPSREYSSGMYIPTIAL
ncbi:Aste57867_5122 [Aphanomyces stellatus]|uniref:Aste57867_5122 protein n=1 Tax=Aphanomyces stellatus TaxID=120398 RepID=A0A485KGQ6_9STRA|nr:hypothetical protein As57867_005109 [Aphanomyces stellatus]VFT82202.1 Aste57867_5122 [Aphanomyces stellatus]